MKLLIFAQSRQCSVVSKKESYKNETKKKNIYISELFLKICLDI